MNLILNRRKIFVLALTIVVLFTGTSYGKTIQELREQQETVKQEREEIAKNLEQTTEQKIIAKSELDNIDIQLLEANDELLRTENELNSTILLLEQTNLELDEAIIKRDEQYETFKERLKVMYEHKDTGYIELILEAKDLTELLKRLEYINYIVEYDNNLVNELTAIEELIAKKVEEIEKQKQDIETLVAEIEIKKANLEALQNEKRLFIEALEADELKYQEQINELDESDKQIEAMIKDAEAAEAARRAQQYSGNSQVYVPTEDDYIVYSGGAINWPVPGRYNISSGYGSRTNPISRKGEFHTGIDIPAPTGTDIVAAEDGIVLSAGWQNGYGYTVVISHGSGLSTLYAHNSKLVVSPGDHVSRGQTISKAGSTGYSTGPHLHFEVRVNGSHTNPHNYL